MRPFLLSLVPTTILLRDNRRCLKSFQMMTCSCERYNGLLTWTDGDPIMHWVRPQSLFEVYLAALIWFILGECGIGTSFSFLFTLILDFFRSYKFYCGNLRYLSSNRHFRRSTSGSQITGT